MCFWVDVALIQRAKSLWASHPWLAPVPPSLFPSQTPLSSQSCLISRSQVTGAPCLSSTDALSLICSWRVLLIHSDMFLILCALGASPCFRWGPERSCQLPSSHCRQSGLLHLSEQHWRCVNSHSNLSPHYDEMFSKPNFTRQHIKFPKLGTKHTKLQINSLKQNESKTELKAALINIFYLKNGSNDYVYCENDEPAELSSSSAVRLSSKVHFRLLLSLLWFPCTQL